MNREQCLIEITKELQLYNKVSTHTMGNIADLLDRYAQSEVNKISSNTVLAVSLPTEVYATYDTKDGEVFCAFLSKEQCEKEAIECGCGMQAIRLVGNDLDDYLKRD